MGSSCCMIRHDVYLICNCGSSTDTSTPVFLIMTSTTDPLVTNKHRSRVAAVVLSVAAITIIVI